MMDVLQEWHINTGSPRVTLPQRLAVTQHLRKTAIFQEATLST